MSKLPPLRCYLNMNKYLIPPRKKKSSFNSWTPSQIYVLCLLQGKTWFTSWLGCSLTWCQQMMNVLMVCTKVRTQIPFHSSPADWPNDKAPFSIVYRASHQPSSQPVVPHVLRSRTRRTGGAKHSNREVFESERKTKLYSCHCVELFNQTELLHA